MAAAAPIACAALHPCPAIAAAAIPAGDGAVAHCTKKLRLATVPTEDFYFFRLAHAPPAGPQLGRSYRHARQHSGASHSVRDVGDSHASGCGCHLGGRGRPSCGSRSRPRSRPGCGGGFCPCDGSTGRGGGPPLQHMLACRPPRRAAPSAAAGANTHRPSLRAPRWRSSRPG